ncbi:MAG: sulfotransferase [Actinomycetota bacterium]|nr:sulfotransferase [Actinomycetota bacterium]
MSELPADRVKVLYIVGAGRSGSTIVDNVLGQIPGYFSAGEIVYFWQRMLVEGRRCGCGSVGNECEVWARVIDQLGTPNEATVNLMIGRTRSEMRIRHVPVMLTSRGMARTRENLGPEYRDLLGGLYRSIAAVSGAQVVVDSSKFPGYGSVVADLPEVDMRVLHLVRDSRAVAYSWLRKKDQPDTDAIAHMMQRRPGTVAPRWMTANVASEALWRRTPGSYVRIRYEDFVADPQTTLDGALQGLGMNPVPGGIIDNGYVHLGTNHTISGNPSRFATGAIRLRDDDEWKIKMSPKDSRLVTAVTWPLLLRYGYSRN